MKFAITALACLPVAFAGLGDRFSMWDMQQKAALKAVKRDVDPNTLYPTYNLSTPVDHLHDDCLYEPHSDAKFPQRYWFDASHYKKGGPVIVLLGGETAGTDRLPYLQKGILAQLAQATNGIGVVLEHRYYGKSYPTSDFSTANLRFLTTDQSNADIAYFAENIVFPGLEGQDLTSKTTPYISYGGSYAGAQSAILRTQYPNQIWGGIGSSGVPQAIWDYWEYFAPIAQYGPPACINAQQTLIQIIDAILISKNDPKLTQQLKTAFGLGNLTHNDDFANTVSTGMSNWQSLNWDPAVNSNAFYQYCDLITNNTIAYPATAGLHDQVASLIKASGVRTSAQTVTGMLNLIGYVNDTAVSSCTQTQDQCFGARNPTYYAQDNLDQDWRLWPYQYCTQWGFLQTGSGVPRNQRPLLSRLIDLKYSSLICVQAFNITTPPDTQAINKYGGNRIAYDRLALIDGEIDPWRPAGPHGFSLGAPHRDSTTNRPFHLIPKAVHHWDENGLFANQTTAALPPSQIKEVQSLEATFVKAWVQQFHAQKA
ncbi:hypothetical protein K461DRAFT_322607 [Myriangium duriaei CBS 260.36]|uniref:Serine carboxypeptidase S28 n=1 Tax=Myriangium duriaei CBS 260.36 TaxID=1168546 RepID=A0A9P4J119_9PEZI|nr:hypothetical protein K461DRAFT_322607 [Myriangium duriaei CBS 260.36]